MKALENDLRTLLGRDSLWNMERRQAVSAFFLACFGAMRSLVQVHSS